MDHVVFVNFIFGKLANATPYLRAITRNYQISDAKCFTQTVIRNQTTCVYLIFLVGSSMFINEDQYLGHWNILVCQFSCLINSYLPIINSYE